MSNDLSFWDNFFEGSNYYTGPLLTEAMVADVERGLGYKLSPSNIRLHRQELARNSHRYTGAMAPDLA